MAGVQGVIILSGHSICLPYVVEWKLLSLELSLEQKSTLPLPPFLLPVISSYSPHAAGRWEAQSPDPHLTHQFVFRKVSLHLQFHFSFNSFLNVQYGNFILPCYIHAFCSLGPNYCYEQHFWEKFKYVSNIVDVAAMKWGTWIFRTDPWVIYY